MSRLTKNFNRNGYVLNHKEDFTENSYQVIQKLGKLEDLEEQLGCSLEIVFKALKNGIYTKEFEDDNKLELFKVRGIEKKCVSVISKLSGYAECDFTCYYEDYKKTWWLKEDKSE